MASFHFRQVPSVYYLHCTPKPALFVLNKILSDNIKEGVKKLGDLEYMPGKDFFVHFKAKPLFSQGIFSHGKDKKIFPDAANPV